MIFSKSGKVKYLCGKCRSDDVLGPIVIYGQQSIVCGPCAQWMPWASRLKVSVGHKLGQNKTPCSHGLQIVVNQADIDCGMSTVREPGRYCMNCSARLPDSA